MRIQSRDKLAKDVEKVLSTYNHLLSGLDSMIEIHHTHTIRTLGATKGREEVLQEIHAFLDPIQQASNLSDLQVNKENITQYIVEPVRIYTKLATL